MERQRGFTLMEMLVVVSIVAILTAIAIPTFSASLQTAREAACAANRRSLKGLLSAAYMTAGADAGTVETVFGEQGAEYTCPSGGTISYHLAEKTGAVIVTCSLHTASFGSSGAIDVLIQALRALSTDADSGAKDLSPSQVLSGSAAALVKALEAEGLDLQQMGAVSWHYSKSSQFFFWTPVDITGLHPETRLPVLRYNLKTGTYTVWIDTVRKSAYGDYLVLAGQSSSNGYQPSTGDTSAENQTYAQAMEHFSAAMEEYPALSGGT